MMGETIVHIANEADVIYGKNSFLFGGCIKYDAKSYKVLHALFAQRGVKNPLA